MIKARKYNKIFERKENSNQDTSSNFNEETIIDKIENKKLSGYIWENVNMTENFKENCLYENNSSNEIFNKIEEILNGNFLDSKEMIHYYKKFLYSTYLYTFPSNLKILFVVYFKKNCENEYDEILQFIDINYSIEVLKKSILKFMEENTKDNNNEYFEFDRIGTMENSNVFYYKIIYEKGKKIYYPFPFSISEKSDKIKKIKYLDKIAEQKVDFGIYELDPSYEYILTIINSLKNLKYEQIFTKNVLDFIPSEKEKELINSNQNLILAGRPGTGKTFIILIKTVLIYLNCLIEKNKHIQDLKFISDDLNNHGTDLKKEFKIIVTSLSQSLCLKAEELFSRAIRNLNYLKYEPTPLEYILKLNSFSDLKKFPSFINFRKLIFMLDGSLNFKFFDRPTNNELKKEEIDCDIRFYPSCKYDCNYSINTSSIGYQNLFYRSQYGFSMKCTEINEDNFYQEFNEQIQNNLILNKNKKISINSFEVYSQIISIIKGSLKSYLSYSNGITLEQYQKIGRKLSLFDEEQRNEIYKYFILYEEWKAKNNYFDIQDLVNYLIRQVNIELVPNNIKLIDILLIDEIQDFSINQLYLMNLISKDIKVLAGDTCQTISKTNVFRFCDLNNVYYTFNKIDNKIKHPSQIQINMNFRCQIPILKLAHSIFEIIFLFFPNTLDKVKLDFSTQLSGFKPSIIYNIQDFINKLSGSDSNKNEQKFNFAFNHCFICRNSKVEKELKEKYNIIYTSTISEAKGLEFEIVVVYNFFKDTYDFIQRLWEKMLRNIKFYKKKNENLHNIKKELKYNKIDNETIEKILNEFEYQIVPEYLKPKNEHEAHSLFNLCSELKELYVSITRAKTFLFFYEENYKVFKIYLDLIKEFNLINEDSEDSINNAIQYLNEHLMDKKQLEKIAEDNYKNGNYKKSEYYYTILGNYEMKTKSEIFLKYEQIEKLKVSLSIKAKQNEFKSLNEEVLDLINKIQFDEKSIKGEVFLNLGKNKNAFDYFFEKKNKFKCGLIKQKEHDYEQAFKFFNDAKKYSNAIDCLVESNNYRKLFNYLKNIKEYIDLEHFNLHYNKYGNEFLKLYDVKIDNKINENYIMYHGYLITQLDFYIPNNFLIYNVNYELSISIPKENNSGLNIYKDFPKLSSFGSSFDIGLTTFLQKHFFPRAEINKDNIKRTIAINTKKKISNNQEIFINITDKKIIDKNIEEQKLLCNKYIDILGFFIDYLQIIQEKSEKSNDIQNFINTYIEQIKNIKSTIYEIEHNKISNDEISEKLDNLLSLRVSLDNIFLFNKIEKEFDLNEVSKKIIDIFIFKYNIVYFLIKSLPTLYRHKLERKNNKIKFETLLDNTLNNLVKNSKLIPLPLIELIKCLKIVLILNGHFTTVFPILNERELLLYSAFFRKSKYFFTSLIQNNITFSLNHNGIYHKDTIYCLNAYLSIFICKYFRYKLKLAQNKSQQNQIFISKTFRDCLLCLQNYVKIYSLLYQIEKNNQNLQSYKDLPYLNVQFNIIYYFEKFSEFLLKDGNISDKELIKYVEIGNTISLFIVINGLKQIKTSFMIGNNIEFCINNLYLFYTKLFNLLELLKIKSQTKNYKVLITIFSLFSALGIFLPPDINEFTIYKLFPICILHKNSIIYWMKEKGNDIESEIYLDSQGKNQIISFNTAFNFLIRMVSVIIENLQKQLFMLESTSKKSYNNTFDRITSDFNSLLLKYIKNRKEYLDNKDGNQNKLFFDDFINSLKYNDSCFFPFYNLEKENEINFIRYCIVLADFPLENESNNKFDSSDKKNILIIFEICQILFREIIFKMKENEKSNNDQRYRNLKNKNKKIFINFLLFIHLFSKYIRFNIQGYDLYLINEEFYPINMINFSKKNIFNLLKITYNKIDFDSIIKIEEEKGIRHFSHKLLMIIWLRKLYPYIFYSSQKVYIENQNSVLYCYYNLNIKIDDSKDDNIFKEDEIFTFLKLLNLFVENDKKFYQKEIDFIKNNCKYDHKNELYYYKTFITNYIQLQLYTIICSLDSLPIDDKSLIGKEIDKILSNYKEKNYYYNKIFLHHFKKYPLKIGKPFIFYTFDINYQKIDYKINLQKVNLNNEDNSIFDLKKITDINLYPDSSIFIHKNLKDLKFPDDKEEEYKKIFSFLFEPISIKNSNDYLKTCELIYEKYS